MSGVEWDTEMHSRTGTEILGDRPEEEASNQTVALHYGIPCANYNLSSDTFKDILWVRISFR